MGPISLNIDDVIDSHTHCGGILVGNMLLESYPYSQDALDLIRKMDANNIRYSVCFPFPISNTLDNIFTPELYNSLIIKETSTFGEGRLLPFAYIRLDDSLPLQIRRIEDLLNIGTFYGVKIYPSCDKYCVCDNFVEDHLTPFLIKHQFPVVFHTSFKGFGEPIVILKYAQKNPKIRISLAHASRFNTCAFDIIKELNNVFLDCSPLHMLCALMERYEESVNSTISLDFSSPNKVLYDLANFFPDKLLWGTDSPCTFLTNYSDNAIKSFSKEFTYESEIMSLRTLPNDYFRKLTNINPIKFLFG